MEEKLIKMGLRLEGEFTLKAGVESHVKWDIEKMSQYPLWVRIETLKEWIWEIGLYRPNNLIGIPTGGYDLACDVGSALNVFACDRWRTILGHNQRIVVIDDVMTTGQTVRGYLGGGVVAIATLVNRSGLSEINGIPIITGIFADRVN